MANSWEMKFDDMDDLLEKIERIPNESEEIINSVLKSQSGDTAVTGIDSKTPISKVQLRRGHRHAKGSNEYRIEYKNLGFIVRPKKRFEYLKYPDLGIGTSQHNAPQEFLKRGLDASVPKIKQQLLQAIDEKLMK